LAAPKNFKDALAIGGDQLLLFVITIIGVLATDLLIGIALGMGAKLIIELFRGVWSNNIFKIFFQVSRPNDRTIVVKLQGSALFSNFLPLKKALDKLEPGKTLVFNFSEAYLIDYSVMQFIDDFSKKYIVQGGKCLKIGQALKKFSDHELSARLMTGKNDRIGTIDRALLC
jgi:MFS superfamily sulfate permease-like transporter